MLIETSDGDVVALKFKSAEALDLNVSESGSGDELLAQVELSARRSTRVAVFIEGDLDDAERAAIASVVAQATALADAFFASGAPAAFALASALDVDGEQLAAVALRLRMHESMTYSAIAHGAALPSLTEAARQGDAPSRRAEIAARLPAAPAIEMAAAETRASLPEAVSVGARRADPAAAKANLGATVGAPSEPREPAPAPSLDADAAPSASPASPASPEVGTLSLFGTILGFLAAMLETFDAVAAANPALDVDLRAASRVDVALKLQLFKRLIVSADEVPALVPDTVDALTAHAQTGTDLRA